MAAVDARQGVVKGRLQAEFQPDFQPFVAQAVEQVEHGWRNAVRPGADRDAHHIRFGQRPTVEGFQFGDIGVGVGVGLEVRDEASGARASGDGTAGLDNLRRNIEPGTSYRTEGHIIAEGAAATAFGAVPVGTGEAGIERDLVHAEAVTTQQILSIRVDPLEGVRIFV